MTSLLNYREYKDYLLTHIITPIGPIPSVYDSNSIYPYVSYSETSARPELKSYEFIELSNIYIKAIICPSLCGKVISLLYLSPNSNNPPTECVYNPRIIRQTRILPRFYFVAGGIE